MSKTTSQKHAELKSLSKKGREGVYQMIALAIEIVGDTEYADSFGGQPQLIDHLQATEFEFCTGGVFKLQQLIEAYERFEKSVWEEHRYSLKAMVAKCQPPKEKKERSSYTDWQTIAKELEAKLTAMVAENDQLKKTVGELHAKIETDREQIGELRGLLKAHERRHSMV